MRIERFIPSRSTEVKALVLGVLAEQGFDLDPGKDSDLDDITGYYLDDGGVFFTGILEGEVIGTAAVQMVDTGKCEIRRVYMKQEFRGRGYGRQLFLQALEYAGSHYPVVTLKTDRSLVRAISLYLSSGFSVVKEEGDTLFFRMDI
ncbi:MAG: GNAT family N-acetyltransferase [ANME-2 cluster archaeon]|nr:GNAT family N-acetyltransferase [ANME-2 cluster archaeon]